MYINNNFNDLAQLPYDAHCHIMTPSEVIQSLVKNEEPPPTNQMKVSQTDLGKISI